MGSSPRENPPKNTPLPIATDPEAELELADAMRWYAQQRPGLEAELLLCIDAALAAIATHPMRYPLVDRGVRRILIDRFPFAVIYTVRKSNILVLAFHHTSRDPERWKKRAR